MVRFRGNEDGLQRFVNKQTRTRVSVRHRSKRKGHQLTPLQKAQLELEREERARSLNSAVEEARDAVWDAAKKMHVEFQSHSAEYYYHLIMQSTCLKSRKRRTSRWNAYLSRGLQRRNAELPEGADRTRVSDGDVARDIAEQWKAMSKEEQQAATDDTLKEMEEHRENHKKGTHTVPIQSFHDARATIANIQCELEDLHIRTGTEILLFAVHTDTSAYNQPYTFWSSKRVADFVSFATQSSVNAFVLKLEGYCISGMQGITYNYVQGLLKLKKDAAVLINKKLRTSTRGEITRMCYVNFDSKITARYGIVIENWPLKKFCAPGEICSRPELETLINAWTNGATCFCSLSDVEWLEWKAKRSGVAPLNDDLVVQDILPNAAPGNEAATATPTVTATTPTACPAARTP
ncbi:hypothetical protein BV20DRAFT_941838 [Pilatotrama ljubarskyi]|nr:hypothetical protein BV20DRAFT_941838 [Pilatotrama ljubarskyi]